MYRPTRIQNSLQNVVICASVAMMGSKYCMISLVCGVLKGQCWNQWDASACICDYSKPDEHQNSIQTHIEWMNEWMNGERSNKKLSESQKQSK